MKHIVLYSGGANSALVSQLVARDYGPDTVLLHTPTNAEHPDADRFRAAFASHIGLPTTVASCGLGQSPSGSVFPDPLFSEILRNSQTL